MRDRWETEPPDAEEKSRARRYGVLLGLKLHLIGLAVVLIVLALRPALVGVVLLSLCLWQWAYMLPAIMALNVKGHPHRAGGVLLVALLTMSAAGLAVMVMVAIFCGTFGRR